MKKNCGQVNTPDVDNTSPCDDFLQAECIVIERESDFVDNIPNGNLNDYLILLEEKLERMEILVRGLEQLIINTPQV